MPQDDNPSGKAFVPIPGSKPDWPMEAETQSYAGRQRMKRTYPGHEEEESRLEDVVPHLRGQSRSMAKAQLLAADAYEKTPKPVQRKNNPSNQFVARPK